ncbi:MAG: hypothetical protein IH934_07135 [Nanoarchaeota archaeon]|nr:hypothetical protein [Nanoarchaeota archaeon]
MIANKIHLGTIIDKVIGSKTDLTVKVVEVGKEYMQRYSSITPPWGGGDLIPYYASKQVRPVTVELEEGSKSHRIETIVDLDQKFEGSYFNLWPEEVKKLEELVGIKFQIRVKQYDPRLLKRIVQINYN